jgi:hypothetical protein
VDGHVALPDHLIQHSNIKSLPLQEKPKQ